MKTMQYLKADNTKISKELLKIERRSELLIKRLRSNLAEIYKITFCKDEVLCKILNTCCDEIDVKMDEVRETLRARKNNNARHIIAYVLKEVYKSELTFEQIASILKLKSHATVLMGIRRMQEYYETEKITKELINKLVTKCKYILMDSILVN